MVSSTNGETIKDQPHDSWGKKQQQKNRGGNTVEFVK